MPRNLIICCDGTNNQFGRVNTDVVRLIQVLDQDPARQLHYYDPGVGTLPEPGVVTKIGKRLSELVGLAFGTGLSWKVTEAYSFLMNYWERGDRVFLFGFSRGAYTVRVVAGLLYALGLLPRGSDNMVPYAMRLFKAIRKSPKPEEGASESTYWKLCRDFRWTFARPLHDGDEQRRFPVHFLGVWDTVSSVGWVWDPAKYQYTARNPGIAIIRHAVSIDERRWFFRQNLMKQAGGQDLKERWFAGVHCDVGGGYPEAYGGLWRVPFEWMVNEANHAGLLIDQQRLYEVLHRSIPSSRPWADPKQESLKGLWWLAEFFPKWRWRSDLHKSVLRMGLGCRRIIAPGAAIHQSALLRIRQTTYAPPNLSAPFLQKVRALSEVPQALEYNGLDGNVNRLDHGEEMFKKLWQVVLDEAGRQRLGIAPNCEDLLREFVKRGVDALTVKHASPQDISKASEDLKAFVQFMAAEAKKRHYDELHEDTFVAAQSRFCPLYPFC